MKSIKKSYWHTQVATTAVIWVTMLCWGLYIYLTRGMSWDILVPFAVAVIGEVIIDDYLGRLKSSTSDVEDGLGVIAKMLGTLEKSPGESREYEDFVFAHLVPYLRKHPKDNNAMFAHVPYKVMYRLIDHVVELAKTEDSAFRSQPEPQDARTYKKILAEIEELEVLSSELRTLAGADLRLNNDTNIEFSPAAN